LWNTPFSQSYTIGVYPFAKYIGIDLFNVSDAKDSGHSLIIFHVHFYNGLIQVPFPYKQVYTHDAFLGISEFLFNWVQNDTILALKSEVIQGKFKNVPRSILIYSPEENKASCFQDNFFAFS